MDHKNSNNGLSKYKMSIPTIQLELDDALDGRRCSILFPDKNPTPHQEEEKARKKRKSSFATFQIVDENNCGV